jgi:hypothetical protein
MPYPFAVREHWIDVSHEELEAFLRDYPRPLEARPPTDRKVRFREWIDPTLGPWPEGSVAKMWVRGSCRGYQVRMRKS